MAEENQRSRQGRLESYIEWRKTRLALASIRILLGLAVGTVSGYIGGVLCAAGLLVFAALYYPTVAFGERRGLRRREAMTVGLVSSIAAYLLGLFLGSAAAV